MRRKKNKRTKTTAVRVNRNYKDRLFIRFFGTYENKSRLLELYNAITHSNYTNEDDLEIYTLEDVVYMKMKNDVSCLLDLYLTLFEHQSSINPNMPVRGFMYFGKMYDKYIVQQGMNVYGENLQMLPTPQYYVLYNGEKDAPDRVELYLSDAFMKPVREGAFEWTAIVLNINAGHNQELLANCKPLAEYQTFVNKVREERKAGNSIGMAVDIATKWCIENHIMADFLETHQAEVKDMVLTEYDEKATQGMFFEDGKEIGKAIGIEKGENLLIAATHRISEGATKEELLAEGYAEKTIDAAVRISRMFS